MLRKVDASSILVLLSARITTEASTFLAISLNSTLVIGSQRVQTSW